MTAAPRILVLDPTPIGALCATGQFKAMLFKDWPHEALFEATTDMRSNALGCRERLGAVFTTEPDRAVSHIARFDPQLIYARPEPENLDHFDFVLRVLREINRPAVLHIMDDWVAGDFLTAPSDKDALLEIARYCAARAALRYTDGPDYVADFAQRLDAPFQTMLNGVDLDCWGSPPPRTGENFVLTHMGNYDSYMSRQALWDIAAAVESMPRAMNLRFNLHLRDFAADEARQALRPFRATHVLLQQDGLASYIETLQKSDVNVYAYNQDPRSVRYMGKGIPNKTCELLAAGRPILAYGPAGFAGLRYLQEHEAATVVTARDELTAAISRLHADKSRSERQVLAARRLLLERHDAARIRARFRADVQALVGMPAPALAFENADAAWILLHQSMRAAREMRLSPRRILRLRPHHIARLARNALLRPLHTARVAAHWAWRLARLAASSTMRGKWLLRRLYIAAADTTMRGAWLLRRLYIAAAETLQRRNVRIVLLIALTLGAALSNGDAQRALAGATMGCAAWLVSRQVLHRIGRKGDSLITAKASQPISPPTSVASALARVYVDAAWPLAVIAPAGALIGLMLLPHAWGSALAATLAVTGAASALALAISFRGLLRR